MNAYGAMVIVVLSVSIMLLIDYTRRGWGGKND